MRVETTHDLERWRTEVLKSDLDAVTKLVLVILSDIVDEQFVAHVSQSRISETFSIPASTFSGRWDRAKQSGFIDVLESRSGSAARWDDDPWTDRVSLLFR